MSLKYYIGYASNNETRFKSSSGGIGSSIIKYLLEKQMYGTSMTFVFNQQKCKYEPKLIYSYLDYNNCGSIYQDTDTIGFIKTNLSNIKNGIVLTCMPCQVRAIKSILKRNNISCFIISLCCSGQTTVEGTWLYYKYLGINKKDVEKIQYRGQGWPSGIQIQLKNGEIVKRANYTYPWTLIHKSLLFRPKRCLSCAIKTSDESDISLADPWLKEYIENDTIGHSIIICNMKGETILNELFSNGVVCLSRIDESTYTSSQLGTIEEKLSANEHKSLNYLLGKMGAEKSLYKKIFTSNEVMLKVHLKILKYLRFTLK